MILYHDFTFPFIHKPLEVAGVAMERYQLRDRGDDIDLVLHPHDFGRLRTLYPEGYFKGQYGDEGVRVAEFECYGAFFGLDYDVLVRDAIDEQDHFVLSLPWLLYFAAKVHLASADRRRDIHLILTKLGIQEGMPEFGP